MAIRWITAEDKLTDHKDIVGGSVSGSTDDIARLLTCIKELKYQRLVILGPTGAGKTVLAELLILEMLKTRRPDDPVPVFFVLSSWNPENETLRTWLSRRISEDYPALRDATSYGPTAVKELIDRKKLIPILDGLDELPPNCLPKAIKRINEALSFFGGIIITSKAEEFRDATRESGVIRGAAVIRALPAETSAVTNFLRNNTSPADAHRWSCIFKNISKNPNALLATTLSNPLMAFLAAASYAGRATNPAELLDANRFPNKFAIETHLLTQLVPSLIWKDRAREEPIRSRDWNPDSASKWLGFIAGHLQSLDTNDFSWWSLYRALPICSAGRIQRCAFLPAILAFILVTFSYLFSHGLSYSSLTGLAYGSIVGVACLLAQSSFSEHSDPINPRQHLGRMFNVGMMSVIAFGVPIGLRTALSNGFPIGLRTGAADGLVAGLVVVLGSRIAGIPSPPECPRRVDFHFRGRGSALIRTLGFGIRAGIVFGAVTGYLAVFRHQHLSGVALQNALASGVIVGLVCGIGSWLISWTRTPVKSDEARSPSSTLQADRTAVLLVSMLLSVTLGGAFGLTAKLDYDVPGVIANGLVGILIGLLSGAWPLYCLARLYLASRIRLPLSLMTFLDECHRMGILRQVGPVYQFRHAKLQHHFARAQTDCNSSGWRKADGPAQGGPAAPDQP